MRLKLYHLVMLMILFSRHPKKGQPLNNKVKKTMSGSIFNLSIKRPFLNKEPPNKKNPRRAGCQTQSFTGPYPQ